MGTGHTAPAPVPNRGKAIALTTVGDLTKTTELPETKAKEAKQIEEQTH